MSSNDRLGPKRIRYPTLKDAAKIMYAAASLVRAWEFYERMVEKENDRMAARTYDGVTWRMDRLRRLLCAVPTKPHDGVRPHALIRDLLTILRKKGPGRGWFDERGSA